MNLNHKIYFFSRDERTHALFRKSWHCAANECGYVTQVICRGFGWWNVLASIFQFIVNFRSRRIVFGTGEILLYSIFSRSNDFWVFTGLGRLIIDEGVVSSIVRNFLRFMYRDQKLIVLNDEDRVFINRMIGAMPLMINGEGYLFNSPILSKNIKTHLTFAFVGRLLKSKGVDQLVASFARHSKPDWKLILIGDNDFSNKDSIPSDFIKYFSSISIGKIVATGFVEDVHTYLREVDILVSLSRREGLPFSILDGISSGVHVFLSPVPGHLSFAGLPGITFVEPSELHLFLNKTSKDIKSLLCFDRSERLEACERKFGQKAIVKSICGILNNHR
jgi:glycosyltransferase involved in cell wall biosynthesis